MKKTLAILLSLALVICMIPGSAFADTVTISSIAIEPIADQTYTGSAITPAVVVTATMSDSTTKTLAATDYTLNYAANTNAGSATVTATVSKNTTTGEAIAKSASFTIAQLDIAVAGITASIDNQTTTPEITVADVHFYKGGVEVSYDYLNSTNIKVETTTTDNVNYTATISGQGNLKGAITATFKKVDSIASATVATNTSGVKVTGTAIDAGVYNKSAKTISSLFYLVGSDNKAIATGNYTVTATDAAGKVVTTATDAGTYNIKVTGINAYGGEKDLTLTIAPKDASLASSNVTVDAITGQYSSAQFNSIVPVVRDRHLGTLTAGKDYSYRVDSGLVTITFMGNYVGTQTVAFTVVPDANDIAKIYSTLGIKIDGKDLSSYVMNPYLSYNGRSQAPYITVSKMSSSYYTIEYRYTDAAGKTQVVSAPVDAADYTIYMVGRNGYGGEVALGTLKINPIDRDYVVATATPGYTTNTPYVYVKTLDGSLSFVQDKDFKVTSVYSSTYTKKVTVYINTMGNIEAGSLTAEYALATKNISNCTAEFAVGSGQYIKYTGSPVKPNVKVRDGYTLLTVGTDYTVTYKDAKGNVVAAPREAGTYTIEIAGKGMYSGTKTLYFYIEGVDISYYDVTLNKTSAKATGSAQYVSVSSVKYGTKALSSSDYTVTYQNSLGQTVTSMSAPGTYKVVVTGKGGYTGSTYATFVITGEPQTVTLNKGESVKVYKDSDPIKVTAKATGDGTGFVYTSSNPEVATVNAYGVVTIKSIGRAKITATTVGMKKSEEASASFVVKVYPDKATISKKPWTEGKKGSLRVRWDIQEDATYYEVRYSRDKSFKKGTYKTKKVTASEKYDTQSTSLKDLYSGKTYYVKVRAVKVVYNDLGKEIKYYGAWSGWRSAKTK